MRTNQEHDELIREIGKARRILEDVFSVFEDEKKELENKENSLSDDEELNEDEAQRLEQLDNLLNSIDSALAELP